MYESNQSSTAWAAKNQLAFIASLMATGFKEDWNKRNINQIKKNVSKKEENFIEKINKYFSG